MAMIALTSRRTLLLSLLVVPLTAAELRATLLSSSSDTSAGIGLPRSSKLPACRAGGRVTTA